MDREQQLTYKQDISKQQIYDIVTAVGIPLVLFGLAIFTIYSYANFGRYLIAPMLGLMWISGVIVGFLLPSMRNEVLNQTLGAGFIYLGAIIGIKFILGIVSGVSSDMIAASFDQAIPTATGNAIPGYLQSMLWFYAVLFPLGEIGMQFKRLVKFRRTSNIEKAMGHVRGIRSTGKRNTRGVER
jgi:hypothetical protein